MSLLRGALVVLLTLNLAACASTASPAANGSSQGTQGGSSILPNPQTSASHEPAAAKATRKPTPTVVTPTEPPTPPPTAPPTPSPTGPHVPVPALLTVHSTPSGATVETGIQCVNGAYADGTGRVLGVTPIEATPIIDADLAECPAGVYALVTTVSLPGYVPSTSVFGFGNSAHITPKTYTINVTLTPP